MADADNGRTSARSWLINDQIAQLILKHRIITRAKNSLSGIESGVGVRPASPNEREDRRDLSSRSSGRQFMIESKCLPAREPTILHEAVRLGGLLSMPSPVRRVIKGNGLYVPTPITVFPGNGTSTPATTTTTRRDDVPRRALVDSDIADGILSL